ncbi:MAG: primase-helicase family protein [Woeseia sp.]
MKNPDSDRSSEPGLDYGNRDVPVGSSIAGNGAAAKFLKALYPEGMWALTAIDPAKKSKIETRTFLASQADEASEWIAKYNGKRNIYFHVNQPKELLTKKATKEDIGAAYFLHADIDPRAGEDVDAEQARIGQLIDQWSYPLPKPHIVIFSGGGFQVFWRLEKKFEIGGSIELAEDFERYNRTIEQVLDADNCHNVDRIMRLPGTMNIPDATKMKKGRKPVQAELVRFSDGVIPLNSITPAPKKQEADAGFGGSTRRVKISGNIQRIDNLDELDKYGIPDYIKVVIAQGSLPPEDCNEKQAKFSRSDWLFKVLCEFVRHEVPDDVAFAIGTDRNWPVTEHVFAQKVSAEKYMIRQIERAHDHAVDPMLEMLNKRYAVIKNLGGKCRIVEEVEDEALERKVLSKITPADFKLAWANRSVQVGQKNDGSPVYKPSGHWWFEHPLRREYDRMVFVPGTVPSNVYNLWQGFTVEPAQGSCTLLLAHIKDNICNGDEEHFQYLVRWMARTVQHPNKVGETAIILRGRQGTGKSFFVKEFGGLFGRHFLQVADAKFLVGSFNNHLRDCVVLFGDEAFYAGDSKHESVLKTLVTEKTLHYEAKGIDSEQGRNFVHLLMATNSHWAVPADMDDRRFFVLDVSDKHQEDYAYFRAIADEMDNGGRGALLLYLLQYDLTGFQVRNVPKTEALIEQQARSLDPWEEAMLEIIAVGVSPDPERWRTGPEWISVTAVKDMLSVRDQNQRSIETSIGLYLKKWAEKGDKDHPSKKVTSRVVADDPDRPFYRTREYRTFYRMKPPSELAEHYARFLVGVDVPESWGEGDPPEDARGPTEEPPCGTSDWIKPPF